MDVYLNSNAYLTILLSKQVSLWTCFFNLSNIREIFSIYNSSYTGRFSKMLSLERRQSWPWPNYCARETEHLSWKSLACNSLSTWIQPVTSDINKWLFVNLKKKKRTPSSYCWNEYPIGQRLSLMSLKFFITSSAIKLWYWSSWYTRFLGYILGIETGEVTWQAEEFRKFGLLGSNIVGTGFNVFINRNRLLPSPF